MQSYTEIPSAQTLQSSLSLLLNNHKTIMSCFSGTAFPTTNLQVGMLCYRTDQTKLFQLKQIVEGVSEWVEIANLSTTLASQLSSKLGTAGGTITGRLTISNTTASTSKTTGALVIGGGLGVGGDVHASKFYGDLEGKAATATKLATARNITMSGAVMANTVSFDGSAGVTLNVTALYAEKLSGIVPSGCLNGTYPIDITGSSAYAASASSVDGFTATRGSNGGGKFLPTVSSGAGVMEVGRYIDFHGTDTSTEDYTVRLDGGGAGSTTLTLSGHFVAGGNVTAYSDRRVKTNIRRIEQAIAKVQKIKGVTFNRKDRPFRDSKRRYMGVIAQDVRKVAPEAVSVHEGRMTVDYMGMTGLLVEAIKELTTRLERIEKEMK